MPNKWPINGIFCIQFYHSGLGSIIMNTTSNFKGMCHTISEEQFEEYHNKGMTMLKERESRNANAEKELEELKTEKSNIC